MAIKKRLPALLAAMVLALPLLGCNARQIQLIIPDFTSSQVEGVNVFRLDDATGAPVLVGRLDFVSDQSLPDGTELLSYQMVRLDGSTSDVLPTYLVRDPSNPDSANIQVFVDAGSPAGWFKVSTFNAYGSSALSVDQTYLN